MLGGSGPGSGRPRNGPELTPLQPAGMPGGGYAGRAAAAAASGSDADSESVDEDDALLSARRGVKRELGDLEIGVSAPAAVTPGGVAAGAAGARPGKKTRGRVKIKMEFIDNKLRRYTTFSKRKTGIMKKAYELSTLTGTQVLLLVASETGHVYTFATRKLQPMITSETGKALIQTCLNSPDSPPRHDPSTDQRMSATGFEETDLTYQVAEADGSADPKEMTKPGFTGVPVGGSTPPSSSPPPSASSSGAALVGSGAPSWTGSALPRAAHTTRSLAVQTAAPQTPVAVATGAAVEHTPQGTHCYACPPLSLSQAARFRCSCRSRQLLSRAVVAPSHQQHVACSSNGGGSTVVWALTGPNPRPGSRYSYKLGPLSEDHLLRPKVVLDAVLTMYHVAVRLLNYMKKPGTIGYKGLVCVGATALSGLAGYYGYKKMSRRRELPPAEVQHEESQTRTLQLQCSSTSSKTAEVGGAAPVHDKAARTVRIITCSDAAEQPDFKNEVHHEESRTWAETVQIIKGIHKNYKNEVHDDEEPRTDTERIITGSDAAEQPDHKNEVHDDEEPRTDTERIITGSDAAEQPDQERGSRR
ncbi:serum response factor-like [Denticeps clupeoides]|uniref:serum response factor-like n=1 Tax=Denticeps clupeoides TaxID=299321 RepID=UPI0010A2DB33|nr:serum response factor-like [Denticeps clupeoides]